MFKINRFLEHSHVLLLPFYSNNPHELRSFMWQYSKLFEEWRATEHELKTSAIYDNHLTHNHVHI